MCITTFLIVFTFISSAVCLAQQTFIKSYGGTDLEQLMHPIIQTPDGGYCMGGITKSFGAGVEDVLLLKTDANGSAQWACTYGGANVDFCHSLARTFDGGYIMSGWTNSFGGGYEAFLLKVSANGSYQWMRTYGWSGSNEYAYSVVQSLDSGYTFLGSTSTGKSDILFVKTDINGAVQWARTFGDTAVFDQGKLLIRTADGGYLLVSRAASYSAGGRDFFLIKTNPSGVVQWSRTYGGKWDENVYDIIKTSDGGYVTCGRTLSYGAGSTDALIVKLSSGGVLQWARTYGDTAFDDFANSIIQTHDGGYATSGHTKSYGAGLDECSLMKIDSIGNLQWTRIFGGTQMDENLTLVQTADSGYALNGFTASYGAGNRDGVLMKTTANGYTFGCITEVTPTVGTPALVTSSLSIEWTSVSPVVGTPSPTLSSPVLTITDLCSSSGVFSDDANHYQMQLVIYPNPFNTRTTIRFSLPNALRVTLKVFDVLGREVAILVNGELNRGEHTVVFDTNDLSNGFYIYQLKSEHFIETKKLLLMR